MTRLLAFVLAVVMACPALGLDVNGQLRKAQFENLSTAPVTQVNDGRVYWDTSELKAKIYNGLAWVGLGSGSGGGAVNLVPNTFVDGSLAGVVDLGTGTTSAAWPVPPLQPLYTAGLQIVNDGSGSGSTRIACFQMPDVFTLASTKLGLTWYQKVSSGYVSGDYKVEVYYDDQDDCGGTEVEVPLGRDNTSGNSLLTTAPGLYTNSFDTVVGELYYEIRIARVAGTASEYLTLNELYNGPGTREFGTVSAGPITWTPTGSWTTNTTYSNGNYWRDCDKISGHFRIDLAGAPTAASLSVNLPTGLTVDTTVMPTGYSFNVGDVVIVDASTSDRIAGTVRVNSSTTPALIIHYHAQNTPSTDQTINRTFSSVNATAPMTWASTDWMTVTFRDIPIAEWAGSCQSNVVRNDTDYAADDGTNDVFGPNGALIPNIATATGGTSRDFVFPTTIQPTDLLITEIQDATSGTVNWTPATQFYPYQFGNNSNSANVYGIRSFWVSDTTYRVQFGNRGDRVNSLTADNGNQLWSVYNAAGARYRVRKINGTATCGFSEATQTGLGVVKIPHTALGTSQIVYSSTNLIRSGTYTPTMTALVNVASIVASANTMRWSQTGRVVTCTGEASVQATAANQTTTFTVTLPIPPTSNFASGLIASGPFSVVVSGGVPYSSGFVRSSTSAKTVVFEYTAENTTANRVVNYMFQYVVD